LRNNNLAGFRTFLGHNWRWLIQETNAANNLQTKSSEDKI